MKNTVNEKVFFKANNNLLVLCGVVANPNIYCLIDTKKLMQGEKTFPCIEACKMKTSLNMARLSYQLTMNEVVVARMITENNIQKKEK